MALNLELIDTFYLWALTKELSIFFFLILFFCNSLLCQGCSALHGVNPTFFIEKQVGYNR